MHLSLCPCVSGAMSEIALQDGGKYNGTLKEGLPHGPGSCVWPDGRGYEGEWRSGKMHGKGTFRAGQHTYVGVFFKVWSACACVRLRGRIPWCVWSVMLQHSCVACVTWTAFPWRC